MNDSLPQTISRPIQFKNDKFEAKIVDATPRAKELGIEIGMSGYDAVELLLAATKRDT